MGGLFLCFNTCMADRRLQVFHAVAKHLSFTKAAVKYVMEKGREQPQVSEQEYRALEKLIFQPLENYRVGRNEIVAGTVSPSYLLPIQGLQRLEKLMDEYVGGISTNYMTNGVLLERGLELLGMLKEDMSQMGAEDLHQLQRTWELQHRV